MVYRNGFLQEGKGGYIRRGLAFRRCMFRFLCTDSSRNNPFLLLSFLQGRGFQELHHHAFHRPQLRRRCHPGELPPPAPPPPPRRRRHAPLPRRQHRRQRQLQRQLQLPLPLRLRLLHRLLRRQRRRLLLLRRHGGSTSSSTISISTGTTSSSRTETRRPQPPPLRPRRRRRQRPLLRQVPRRLRPGHVLHGGPVRQRAVQAHEPPGDGHVRHEP